MSWEESLSSRWRGLSGTDDVGLAGLSSETYIRTGEVCTPLCTISPVAQAEAGFSELALQILRLLRSIPKSGDPDL
jgi:hypothetical protein